MNGDSRPSLTLSAVAADPYAVSIRFTSRTDHMVVFRPLVPDDGAALTAFLESLSPLTRRFWVYPSYDSALAREMCEAINRYDKLRMVAVTNGQVVALYEFSLCIPDGDRERFRSYGYDLDEQMDIRFGPCIADDYQNVGLGFELFPHMMEIARRFGRKRVVLWGGVFADNARAIGFYRKCGFKFVGEYEAEGQLQLDAILVL